MSTRITRNHAATGMSLSSLLAVLCLLVSHSASVGMAGDWPTYRHDAARSGVGATEDSAPQGNLALQWSYVPLHPPDPAWPATAEEMPRMHADNAFHVAVAEGRVFFGSSVTDEVTALDASSGKIVWSFLTEGPVRFAPTVSNGRVYVGSDDGYVYCLKAADGTLVWKYRPGPSDEKVLGNERMISLWPVRTSVLVDQGTVYCGAGVFPYEGIYICALNADNGAVVWKNDTIGDRAHELAFGGLTPHGYLVASPDILYVPAGRAMPAAFSRKTGDFLFWASPGGKQGGAWSLLNDNQLIAGVDRSGEPHKAAYDAKTGANRGDVFAWFPGVDLVVRDKIAYVLTPTGVYAIDREVHAQAVRKASGAIRQRETLAKELVTLRKQVEAVKGEEQAKMRARIEEIGRLTASARAEEKRLQDSCVKWHLDVQQGKCLILVGDTLFVGGDAVRSIDAQTGRRVGQAGISGRALGLAVSGNRLIVSTDAGRISCFAAGQERSAQETRVTSYSRIIRRLPQQQLYRDAARRIVDESKITKGYCLVLDCNLGQLAYELAQITKLKIVGLEKDPQKLQKAREGLREAGLLGVRVVVEPWNISDLPPYFANLIVSDALLTTGTVKVTREELERVLRPAGGTIVAGRPGDGGALQWWTFQRPKLEQAGSWTHEYGNPQNTACSDDQLAKGPLGVLWFGEPGPMSMVERHARAQSPVAMDGRMFIQGEELILAVDAYNGTQLWQRRIPGAVRPRADVDGGNLALTEEALYVAAHDRCLRLDPATGATVRVYNLPDSSGGAESYRWSCVWTDRNILFGIRAEPMKQPYAADLRLRYAEPNEEIERAYTRSNGEWFPMANYPLWENYNPEKGSVTGRMMGGDMVFALHPETGSTLWTHPGKRIGNLTISVGEGKIFFAESGVSEELSKQALDERRDLIGKGVYEETASMKKAGTYTPSDIRVVVALDAASGKKLWEKPVDFTGCCGDAMGSAYQKDVLLFFGCVGNHDAWRFQEDLLAYRRIVAMSASTGEILWSRPINYRVRPVIIGDKIVIEPRACDLRTGKILTRVDPITGQQAPWEFLRPGHTCAITSASPNALFYRSSCVAMYDLDRDAGVTLFGGIRPGCWINMIPANGIVLVPEASVGCTCSYPLRGSFALINKPQRAQPWTVYINHTESKQREQAVPRPYDKPVKHLGINFGAPADMKDDQGTLWLAYPNPKTVYSQNHFANYGIKFNLSEVVLKEMGYFCHDFKGVRIEGTDKPWLFTSGCLGLLRCEIPVREAKSNSGPGTYTVRLGFRPAAGDKPGQRVCAIKLQGRTVVQDFDVARIADGADKAVVQEFKDIAIEENLLLELAPKAANPDRTQAPLLNFVEIIQ